MKLYLLSIILFSLFSCSDGDYIRLMREQSNKEIKFPESATWQFPKRDSLIKKTHSLKILSYYPPEGCTSCNLIELLFLDAYIKEINNLKGTDTTNVDFLFVFGVKDIAMKKEVESVLKKIDRNILVLLDTKNEFKKNNLLPDDKRFFTMLLDKNNKIVLMGSPVGNERLWALYKSQIARLNKKYTADNCN